MSRLTANNDIMAADLAKMNVISTIETTLLADHLIHQIKAERDFIESLGNFGGFQIFGKTFSQDFDDARVKIKLINRDDPDFEAAQAVYEMSRQIRSDIGIIQHFLALFLNKCPNPELFYEIIPKHHINKLIKQHLHESDIKHFHKDVAHCIQYRQNARPTKAHQYDIFINDHENKIELLRKYIIDSMLI